LTRQQNRFVIGLADGQAFPEDEVRRLGYVVEAAAPFVEVVVPDGKSIDPVLALLSSRGANLRHLVEKKQSLEDVFVSMVDSQDPGTDRRPRRARPVGGQSERRK
jgi:ABC-2 type transport system ATP-binding protein